MKMMNFKAPTFLPCYKIKITEELQGDLLAQYKGVFLNEIPLDALGSKMYGGTSTVRVSKGTEIRINFDAVKVIPKLGVEVMVDGIFSVYAQNEAQGALLEVTKL